MRAGTLRQRVTIQDKSVVRDTYGGETISWTDVAEVWAAVEPLQGREYLEARQTMAEVTTRIRVRYRSGITPEMRVEYDSRNYEILAVIHVREQQRELHLMCREFVT